MDYVMKVLGLFCQLSCEQVINAKTSIMFSKNVDQQTKVWLTVLSCFREVQNLGKYLGFRFLGGCLKTLQMKDGRGQGVFFGSKQAKHMTNWNVERLKENVENTSWKKEQRLPTFRSSGRLGRSLLGIRAHEP